MRYTLNQAVDEIKAYKRYKNLPYNDDVEVQAPVTAKAPEQSFQSKDEAPKVAEQAKPVVKSEPVKAAEPARPVEKKAEPAKPAAPAKPVEKKADPAKVAVPVKPDTKKTEPEPVFKKAEPVKAAEPAKPVEKKAEPVKAAEPAKPVEKKAEPVKAAEPVKPVEKKAEPVKAAEPVKPVEKKAEPVKAAEPVKPVEKKAEPVKAAEPVKPVEKKEEAPRPARVAFTPIQPYQFQPYQAENTQKVGMRYTLDQAEAETEAYKKYKNLRSENAVSDATYEETSKKEEPAKSEPVNPTPPARPVDRAPAESAAPVKSEPAKSEPVNPTPPAKPVDRAPAESAAPVKGEPAKSKPSKTAEPAKAVPEKPAEKPVEKKAETSNVRVVTFDKPSSGEVAFGDPFEEEVKKFSAFRYGLGAVLAFFGFSSKTHRASKKRAKLVGDIFTYIILLFGTFIMVYPFWWMIAGSFADTASTTISGDVLRQMVWWPQNTTVSAGESFFRNYDIVFNTAFKSITVSNRKAGMFAFLISNSQFNFWVALLNNLVYSIVPVVVGVITSASAAFSFAKIQWIGRNAVFYFLLAAIMVPGPSIMISQYVMYNSLGWRNNGLVMIIPGLFGSIMTAFFIRQFLFGLPTSIIEAAKIDGAGYFRIFCGFILPLAMPAIMAQGILSFMGCWNNYMASFIMIDSNSSAINLPHAITLIANNAAYETDVAVTIAASVISVIPVMILFACFQNLIIGSLMLTGSKE